MKLLSFRLKIALLSALISGVVWLGFGAASWHLIYRQKVAAVDTEIRSLGARHPGWLANRGNLDRFNSSLEHANEPADSRSLSISNASMSPKEGFASKPSIMA